MALFSQLPARREFGTLLRWYERQLPQAGVEVVLNQTATAENVKAGGFDVCLLASGRGYKPSPVPVQDDAVPVYTAMEVLTKKPMLPQRVAVIGGSFVGLELARQMLLEASMSPEDLFYRMRYGVESDDTLHAMLKTSDRQVAVFEKNKLGAGYEPGIAWPTLGDLKTLGATLKPKTTVTAITSQGVQTEAELWPCQAVVVCPGTQAEDTLFQELEGVLPCLQVGNAHHLGRVINAVEEACEIGCTI
jgi:2,4-dienoyl-CoA reductase (NADPH2)